MAVDTATGYEALDKTVFADELFGFEFAAQLGAATITSAISITATAQGKVVQVLPLTVDTPVIQGTEVQAQLAEGTDGEDYLMEARLQDSNGNFLSMFGILQVRD